MIFLNDAERTQLKIHYRHQRNGRIRHGIKALLLSRGAIRDHIAEYKDSKKLKLENGGSVV